MCKQVKEYPILFQGDMVRAILNQKPGVWPAEPIDPALPMKWQTRRIVKPQPPGDYDFEFINGEIVRTMHGTALGRTKCPHGRPGDTLWMRETWATLWMFDDIKPSELKLPEHGFDAPPTCSVWYRADGATDAALGSVKRWRPSIFMPRWACRLELDVLSVGVERVQLISEADAVAEGIVGTHFAPEPDAARERFRELWDSINAKRGYSWESNPWVWVVKFSRREEAGHG